MKLKMGRKRFAVSQYLVFNSELKIFIISAYTEIEAIISMLEKESYNKGIIVEIIDREMGLDKILDYMQSIEQPVSKPLLIEENV